MRQEAPERLLRGLLVWAACAPALFLLSLLRARAGWQRPELWGPLLVGVGLLLLRGERHPHLADDEPARRAARYAPMVVGVLLFVAPVFPRYLSWPALWFLALLELGLLPFAFVPRIRAIALVNGGAIALGLTVLEEQVAWILIPLAAACLLVPTLDRLLEVRYSLSERVRPRLGRALSLPLLALGLGGAVFALLYSLLPETANDYAEVGLLDAVAPASRTLNPVSLPLGELVVLCALIMAGIGLINAVAGRESEEQLELELPPGSLARLGGAAHPAPLGDAGPWPAGARRELVDAYLAHLDRLEPRLARRPGETPARLGRRVPQRVRGLAQRLAERFARARWAPGEVSAAEVEAARVEVAEIEAAWPDEAEGSGA